MRFCNRIRSCGKSETILESIKKGGSDISRIRTLLTEEPDLCSLLGRNISQLFERKDELVASKLWKRGSQGKSLELLTEAFARCPIPACFEERIVSAFDGDKSKVILQAFMQAPLKEINDDAEVNIMEGILYDRGCILFSSKRYLAAYRDFMRAWLLNYPKTLDLSFRIAVCYFECGELDVGKELLQCTAQYLRTMSMSNEEKSVWTMNIVKALKAIETSRKQTPNKPQLGYLNDSLPTTNSLIGEFSALLDGESQKVSQTSEVLELQFSPEKGRHMLAKRDIPPGSTLIAEMPYAWTISKPSYHKFCHWCLLRIECGIPCSSCASAVFCNATCRDLALNSFHERECTILKLLDSSQKLGNMALLCFRTILTTPLSTVLQYANLINQDSLSHDVIMGLNDNNKLESSAYSAVFAQTPNSEQRQAGDLLKRTFSAVYLTLALKHVGYFDTTKLAEDDAKTLSEKEISVAALMLRHLQGASCNAYGINYIEKRVNIVSEEEKQRHLQIDEVGGATYPVISTTNHSCNPNAYRINIPGRMCLVKTLRDIQKGEQVFDGYGPLYLTEARQERISKLQTQYLFRCSCPPCTEDWPMYGPLRKAPMKYKCSSCLCELKVDPKNIHNKLKCPYCDKVTDMKKLLNSLKEQKETFALVKTSIIAEAFQPFDKDIEEILTKYIQLCQKAYLDPCIESVEAQEILKLFWNISIRNS
ncbi:SET and MYND domain-containing protein 4 [Orchesella cincta]|uniref:SET and MYND domain-containing protein 4 n=1 Tax=Orchesella cincta TaxID=48709 RepID=A0A1D2N2S6_ORCCI|nr:SET and MYND domain-containing protein 4 [Orchesella cincta]